VQEELEIKFFAMVLCKELWVFASLCVHLLFIHPCLPACTHSHSNLCGPFQHR